MYARNHLCSPQISSSNRSKRDISTHRCCRKHLPVVQSIHHASLTCTTTILSCHEDLPCQSPFPFLFPHRKPQPQPQSQTCVRERDFRHKRRIRQLWLLPKLSS
ncbi:hypothetical protein M440DRAFT_70769 [Trichoderma longibrachiatum ATCC 18648]|uniref:Uncharacterized protein n=1 Tax=Trichoderma longibrachiatum ATCC 18648 TaxID=983965 RepID=A0A2T4CH67_TRILO|nr:hypothetical protein M440DRAFT_70769 [Trichoderma longibrachiatum ATCC 18648]